MIQALKAFLVSLLFFSKSSIGMEQSSQGQDLRLSNLNPIIKQWLCLCDRISDIANDRIIPLLAIQSNVGNEESRILSENESYYLKSWQSYQETINKTALDAIATFLSPELHLKEPLERSVDADIIKRDFTVVHGTFIHYYKLNRGSCHDGSHKVMGGYQELNHFVSHLYQLKEMILPTIIEQFQSYTFKDFSRVKREKDSSLKDAFSQETITAHCKQKCLELSFEIEGVEEKLRVTKKQIALFAKSEPINEKIVTKLTLKSLEVEADLAGLYAQKNLSSNILELFTLMSSMHEVFTNTFIKTQDLRLKSYLGK